MLKKILILLFVAVFLSGCTPKLEQEEVTFSSWGSVTEVQILKQIIQEFEKENPDIKIKFMHIPQNYFQKIHLLFASNTAPDVIFINNLYLPIYAEYLEDITSQIESDTYYMQALKGLSYDDKILAFPRDISNLVFYVNTDMVKTIREDWTIEDLLEIAKQNVSLGRFGLSFEEDFYWVMPYLSYFGEVFDESFDSTTSQGLKFYKELRDKYKVAPTKSQVGSSTLAQMFLDGRIAMYLSGRWMYPKIREKAKFNWMVINFPYGEIPQVCDASGWAISKNSKHKKSALEFAQFLSSKKSIEYFTKTGLIVPARVDTAFFLNNLENNEKSFLDIVEKSQPTFITKNYKKLIDSFNSKSF